MSGAKETDARDDTLRGAKQIAAYLGISGRAVFHHVEAGHLPVYRLGRSIHARKTVLAEWRARQEADAAGWVP